MTQFDNSYARLPERFFTRQTPIPVKAPELIAFNAPLASELGLTLPDDKVQLAAYFSGNKLIEGAEPLAQVYAGHQFGGWSAQLGDGRAVLLGEVISPSGQRRDIQLKGAGRTPYSRMGDGRAWLGPVLREYVISEAMSALGIPTTRALAAVLTGERIQREKSRPGAIFTRVASSHIRIGTFQYFAARDDRDALRHLTEHTIERHAPDADGPTGLLTSLVDKQARLIAQWMSVGFIHGVMNTDNMTLSGETIDYGPCAFMDRYHPQQVFSSIDQFGRYAYGNQPQIAVWNIAQFATALLPLMDDTNAAIESFTEIVNSFSDVFDTHWQKLLHAKLGLQNGSDLETQLGHDLLDRMAQGGADFTNCFRGLSSDTPSRAAQSFEAPGILEPFLEAWRARLGALGISDEARIALMRAHNPGLIPRNHQVEKVIEAGLEGDFAPFHRLNKALEQPFDVSDEFEDLTEPPAASEMVHQTFCGT